MNRIKNKFLNYHPSKWESLSFLMIPILIGILYSVKLDNDIWFLLNYGRYILNHGFPIADPFTIHEGLNLVIQQWVVDVIFYKIYEIFGKVGIYLIVNIVNIYIVFITYKLLMLVTNKKRNLSVLFTVITVSLFDFCFLTSRPQIFSSAILLTELYVLERYFKTNNYKILFLLPLLSLLMINFHASMWLLLFCFWLPFFISRFKFKLGKIESNGGNKKELLITALFMLLVGFINPYGLKSMTYILTSYNVPYIYNFVNEMKIPDIHSTLGMFIYISIFLVYICYIMFVKKEIKIYHFLLLLGTTYLAISSNRGIVFFIIASIYPLTFYLEDKFYYIKETEKTKNTKKLFVGCILILGIIPFSIVIMNNEVELTSSTKEGINYLVKTDNKEKIKLYCSYEQCNYAEYLGIKVYTDSRAEVFLKVNNNKENILEELYKLKNNQLNVDEFLEKYDFTHLLINNGDSLYEPLLENPNYEIIYKEEFKEKNKSKNTVKEENKYIYVIFKKIKVIN